MLVCILVYFEAEGNGSPQELQGWPGQSGSVRVSEEGWVVARVAPLSLGVWAGQATPCGPCFHGVAYQQQGGLELGTPHGARAGPRTEGRRPGAEAWL